MKGLSNTSPINYFTFIELDQLLLALFGRMIISPVVHEEIRSPGASPQIGEMLKAERVLA
ncbi:MAG TPA: hypothetical protein VG672_04220 [Bryobacteraceae bacterium]|jgi:hypothetical protein|nr:hypothetical protein [Bryobacteraceae bacterium]